MRQGLLRYLYIILTFGVFFIALGNAHRFYRTRKSNDPLATRYADRQAEAELSIAVFILCLLAANLNPGLRVFTPWWAWFYWAGISSLLIGRLRLAAFISGDLLLRPSIVSRIRRWLRVRWR